MPKKAIIPLPVQHLSSVISRTIFFSLFFLAVLVFCQANETNEKKSVEKFNAGELIMDHISDAHEWHLWGAGDAAVSIPLPVIIYSKDRGLSVFSSAKFHHGHKTYQGYKVEHNSIVAVNEMNEVDAHDAIVNPEITKNLWDISITKNVVTLFFSCLLMLWLFISVAKTYLKNGNSAPSGKQSLIEPIIVFIRDEVAKPSIGPRYEKYVPYLLTLFFFIFINNLLGLVPAFPFGTNLSGNIAVTMSLSLITLVVVTFTANRSYWRHIFAMPGVPFGILFILTPIEILGFILRPFVLMIRLFANITAGHIIALSFYSLIFIFGEMNTGLGYGVSVLSVAFTVFMGFLELLVALLQAYVFAFLSAMYFGAAIEEHHH
ncbi:MAG: F0F1 ATP synthase subunit A [Bacteroidia bacterium]|nr:F0F1 ATP synthase subunit A [Bacteroidia bacterium]